MACMDKTPKKIVRSELLCFLSGCTLTKELKECGFFGKSSVGIQGVIKVAIDIDVTVFSSSELFICTSSWLIRFEKNLNNLSFLRGNIKCYYKRGGF